MRDTDKSEEDRDLERLLRAAGPRREPPAQLKQAWERQFRAELALRIAARKRQKQRRLVALCAAVTALAIGLGALLAPEPLVAPPLAVIHTSGDTALQGSAEPLRVGDSLQAGAVIATGNDGHVAVTRDQHEIRLNVDTRLEVTAGGARLLAGEIYVRDRPGAEGGLRIDTAHGSVEDIGTQFTVAVSAAGTVTRVREGSLLVTTPDASLRADAGGGSARQVIMQRGGGLSQQSVSASGSAWSWTYAAGPGYALEGSSAHDFLQWVAAERGLDLEFTTRGAEIYARTTLLHGELGALDAETALAPVLATTDLAAEDATAGRLRIALRPR